MRDIIRLIGTCGIGYRLVKVCLKLSHSRGSVRDQAIHLFECAIRFAIGKIGDDLVLSGDQISLGGGLPTPEPA